MLTVAALRSHLEARDEQRVEALLRLGVKPGPWQINHRRRVERERFLVAKAFARVLVRLPANSAGLQRASALVDFLCWLAWAATAPKPRPGKKRRGRKSPPAPLALLFDPATSDAWATSQRMEEDRENALAHLIAAADLLGPNYQPRLAEIAEQVARDPWPSARGDVWATAHLTTRPPTKGKAAFFPSRRRGEIVRRLHELVPGGVRWPYATIRDLLGLAGVSGITKGDVKSILDGAPPAPAADVTATAFLTGRHRAPRATP